MPSKEKDEDLDTSDVDLNNPRYSGLESPKSEEKNDELRDEPSPKEGDELGEAILWEKRYESLWVELEKREVKSTFKNVASELKEKFGELPHSNRCAAADISEEEQAKGESPSAEASSDEEEGEPIVRPTARARSTVLLPILEQRESGLEDSITESAENSHCEVRIQDCAPQCDETQDQDPLSDCVQEECRFPSPHLVAGSSTSQRDCNIDHATKTSTNGYDKPISDIVSCNSALNNETKHMELSLDGNTADLDEAEKNHAISEEDPEDFSQSQHPSLSVRSAATPGVSDEELEEDMQRFKHEVGMLKVVFLDLEKEKAQLQKEVDDGRPFLP